MTLPTTPPRRLWSTLLLACALGLVLIGAVMADTHDPVAIAPDAPRAGGASVVTFALG